MDRRNIAGNTVLSSLRRHRLLWYWRQRWSIGGEFEITVRAWQYIHNTFVALIHSRIVCDIEDATNEVNEGVWLRVLVAGSHTQIGAKFWYDCARRLLFCSAFVLN